MAAVDDTEAADLFGRWAQQQGLLSRITEDQCADLAHAFLAGWFYGQNPLLRESLRSAAPAHPGSPEEDQHQGDEQAREQHSRNPT